MTQVYKCLNGLAPPKLSYQSIKPYASASDSRIKSRSREWGDLELANIKLTTAWKSFRYRGPQLFNMALIIYHVT